MSGPSLGTFLLHMGLAIGVPAQLFLILRLFARVFDLTRRIEKLESAPQPGAPA